MTLFLSSYKRSVGILIGLLLEGITKGQKPLKSSLKYLSSINAFVTASMFHGAEGSNKKFGPTISDWNSFNSSRLVLSVDIL